jgi:hypothetical protein
MAGSDPAIPVSHESDIRPSLPFSEEQARALLRPIHQPTEGP